MAEKHKEGMREHRGIVLLILLLVLASLDEALYAQAFKPAEPIGGKRAVQLLLNNEFVYPLDMRHKVKKAEAHLLFTVDMQGRVTGLTFRNQADSSLVAEVKRLFAMIEWKAADFDGENRPSQSTLRLNFSHRKYERICRQRGYDTPPYPYEPMSYELTIFELKQLTSAPSPVYHDGSSSIRDYLQRNLVYPPEAAKRDIQGTVNVRFVVEPSGRVSNLHVTKAVGAGCDEEALRLMEKLRWTPGIHQGKYVRSWMEFSISFNLGGQGGYQYHPTQHGGNIQ